MCRETLHQYFVEAREEYDVAIVTRKGKEKELATLEDNIKAEQQEHEDYVLLNKQAQTKKDVLQAKLQTMTLKCTEMQENLQNEQQKLVIMKTEMYEHLNLIQSVKEQTDETKAIYGRMDALRRAANTRRETAEFTMDSLEHDLDAMRGNLAVQLSHMLSVKQQIKAAQRTMMKGQAKRMHVRCLLRCHLRGQSRLFQPGVVPTTGEPFE